MNRHIADRRAPSDGTRVSRFLAVERTQGQDGSHPATRTLTRRPKTRDDARRVQEFVRIARGEEA